MYIKSPHIWRAHGFDDADGLPRSSSGCSCSKSATPKMEISTCKMSFGSFAMACH